jgi:hypothetical protein
MNKTTTMGWMTVALLAGALSLPGLALADRGYGYERHYPEHRGHWRRYDHGHHRHWDRDREVVVVREPVYVEPRRPVVVSPWATLGNGITVILRNDW